MPSERILLSSLKTITFYEDTYTNARRADPIRQLTCVGSACNLYKPDAVQCFNVGGQGVDVNWKCEADLPEALRFGRVDVSCEGWAKPGDPYVLKGSCGLEYRLVRIPNHLYNNPKPPNFISRWITGQNPLTLITNAVWIAAILYLVYRVIRLYFYPSARSGHAGSYQSPRPPPNRPGGGGWGSGWMPGNGNDARNPPPPPYSKSTPDASSTGWRPGFWTGVGLGGLATQWYNNRRQEPAPSRQAYDWERDRTTPGGWVFGSSSAVPRNDDTTRTWHARGEGEGSSNLGQMRRSTGVGGSSVR